MARSVEGAEARRRTVTVAVSLSSRCLRSTARLICWRPHQWREYVAEVQIAGPSLAAYRGIAVISRHAARRHGDQCHSVVLSCEPSEREHAMHNE